MTASAAASSTVPEVTATAVRQRAIVPATSAGKVSWPESISGAKCCGGITWSRHSRRKADLEGGVAGVQNVKHVARSTPGKMVVEHVQTLAGGDEGLDTTPAAAVGSLDTPEERDVVRAPGVVRFN